MTKQEFLKNLSDKLQGIPKEDREASLDYYSEMIDDRVEDGLTEEQAVKLMGSINDIAEKIIGEVPLEKLLKTKVSPKRKLSGAEIALLAILFPIWFPLTVTAIALGVVLYLLVWVLILLIYVIVLSFAVSGIGCIVSMIMNCMNGQVIWGFFLLGCGMVLFGLAIPIFFGAVKATFGYIGLTARSFKSIKSKLAKRKGDVK